MNTLRLAAIIALLVLINPRADAAAKIYKSVDKDGNVTFTDVPPADRGKADLEVVSEINSYATGSKQEAQNTRTTRQRREDRASDEVVESFSYTSISIIAPDNDESLRDNAGNVTISISTSPPLQSNHHTEILLDGAVVSNGNQKTLELTNLDRGTHVVSARIVDASGNTLLTSEPSTFHLQRYSSLQRQARAR